MTVSGRHETELFASLSFQPATTSHAPRLRVRESASYCHTATYQGMGRTDRLRRPPDGHRQVRPRFAVASVIFCSLRVFGDGQQRLTTLYLLLKGKIPTVGWSRDGVIHQSGRVAAGLRRHPRITRRPRKEKCITLGIGYRVFFLSVGGWHVERPGRFAQQPLLVFP